MANTLYTTGRKGVLEGSIDLLTDTICIALAVAGYTPADTHSTWADVSAQEVTGVAGYTSGGVALASRQVLTDATTKKAYFTSNSALWTSVTMTARWGILYRRAGGSPTGTDKLIGCIDFGAATTSTNSNFEIQPNATLGWYST